MATHPSVCVEPALVMVMAPPKAHVVVQVWLTTGFPATSTSGTPGVHGTGCGVHGCGVSTPDAAEVALATAGFDKDEHMPNNGMFTVAALSWIVATGLPSTSTWASGRTVSVAAPAPKLQVIRAEDVVSGAGMDTTLGRRPPRSRARPARLAAACSARSGARA